MTATTKAKPPELHKREPRYFEVNGNWARRRIARRTCKSGNKFYISEAAARASLTRITIERGIRDETFVEITRDKAVKLGIAEPPNDALVEKAEKAIQAEAKMSKAALELVEAKGLDPAAITGTGSGGKITKGDVDAFIEAAAAADLDEAQGDLGTTDDDPGLDDSDPDTEGANANES